MSKSNREVWHPAEYDTADIRAVQTLFLYAMGAEHPWPPGEEPPTPSPSDVKRFLDWVINGAARTFDNGFVPNDPNGRTAAYVDGSQSVGQQIIKLSKIKIGLIDKSKET